MIFLVPIVKLHTSPAKGPSLQHKKNSWFLKCQTRSKTLLEFLMCCNGGALAGELCFHYVCYFCWSPWHYDGPLSARKYIRYRLKIFQNELHSIYLTMHISSADEWPCVYKFTIKCVPSFRELPVLKGLIKRLIIT